MSDKKTTQLDAVTTLAETDILPVIAEVSTTPVNKKITVENVRALLSEVLSASIASSATPTPTAGARRNLYFVTALAAAAEFAAPTGTLSNGDSLVIRIKDNGTRRALTWNAIYRGDMPTDTIDGTLYAGFFYNSTDSKWDCVAVGEITS